jgi:hAT family C-terminal dimerisation region
MIDSCLPLKIPINATITEQKANYELKDIDDKDWIALGQLHEILEPFYKVSNCVVPEFLGRLFGACLTAFYFNVGKEEQLDPRVRQVKHMLREDLGRRLWKSGKNDLLIAGVALHPEFKWISPPAQGIPQYLYAENHGENMLTFFFRNFREKMKQALLNLVERFNLKVTAGPVDTTDPSEVKNLYIFGYRRSSQGATAPIQEIDTWLGKSCDVLTANDTVEKYWERCTNFPLLQKVARIVFVAQVSAAPSERVWSLAGDLCGDERSSMGERMLCASLVLKKNVRVRAKMESCSLFAALDLPKSKRKQ